MRGYFGIGVEGVSKAMNVGSLFRSAHAFGASFLFTVAAAYPKRAGKLADTSNAPGQVPFYEFPDVAAMVLPDGCALVGIELHDDAEVLPSFFHPQAAAYVLGPERGALSDAMVARCDHVVKIPTQFSVNLGIAGAIVMYDRTISLGRFAERPLSRLAAPEPPPAHVFGDPKIRQEMDRFLAAPPEDE
jgi:tRNA G18 (ribose-2'-O)-methylase SpoU